MELSAQAGDQVYWRANNRLLGELDLALGDFAAAAARLYPMTSEPSALSRRSYADVMPETVEALIGAGDLDAAGVLLADLKERYRDPLTAAAAAARCSGSLAAARGELDRAAAELRTALGLHDQVTRQPVQVGRTLLALGAVQRRLKQRRAARETIETAIDVFESAGAALWAVRAREALARVSGRLAGAGELTATERRVAELIASGMSNRAAAAELFVAVRTIESTLTRIYAELGVTSRTQLARHLRDRA
jgi:DNA-binding CsgD family transcriptional regulator